MVEVVPIRRIRIKLNFPINRCPIHKNGRKIGDFSGSQFEFNYLYSSELISFGKNSFLEVRMRDFI